MIHKKLLSLLVLLMTTVIMSAIPATQITVTVPTGNSIKLNLNPSSTIGDVKEKIKDQTRIPTELQILTLANQELNDEQQLSQLPSLTEPFTLSLVSGNYYLNGGSTDNCPVSFKVFDSENAGTAQEGDEVTVTFTPTAPYVLTAVTAQAYTTWAGARRAVPEPTLTIPMLGDITLTPVQGQDNTYTFTMPPSHVMFNTTLRQPSGLAWMLGGNKLADGATVNYCKGFPFTAPVLVKPNDLVCQLKADDGITINVNGAVTVNDEVAQPGTHTITVSSDDDGTYQATTVKFDLVISEPAILSVAADPTTGGTVEVVMPESGLTVQEIKGDMVAGWNDDQYSSEYMTAQDLEGFQEVPLDMAKAWQGAPITSEQFPRLYYAFDGNAAYWADFNPDGEYDANRSGELTKGAAYDMILNEFCTVPLYYTTGYTPVTVIANSDGTYSVVPGTIVSLKATPAEGYEFDHWENATADTDDNTVATITVEETTTATAYFGAKEYEVDLTVNGDDDQGTEKANWTGKAGEQGTAKKFPITAKTGQMVIANYDGNRKVKSVKAVLVPTYLKWDATKKKWVEADIPANATKVENVDGNVTWEAGTYLVEGNVTINGTVQLSGDVELIIKDGAKLNANHIFGDNYSLNIYGQANKSGELNVANSYGDAIYSFTALNVHSCKVNASSSLNYYGGFNDIDEFNLYGGSVDATGGPDGYGLCDIPSLKIWGGEMKAEGKGDYDFSYGITYDDYTTSVTVYGGKLWVKADSQALDPSYKVTFTKDDSSTTGKIQTSDDGTEWTDYNGSGKPGAKYVRVGY